MVVSMVYVAVIAVLIALGVLVMMYDEISTGYYRWRDYLITIPLLYGTALLILFADSLMPTGTGLLAGVMLVVRALMGFLLLVVVWGGTLNLGSLLIRLLLRRTSS